MGQGLSRNKSNATYFEADPVADKLLGLLLYFLHGRFRVHLQLVILKNLLETCFESGVTTCWIGEVSRRMSPITRVIDLAWGLRGRLVIVLGAHDNTSGVSVLGVSLQADAG